MIGLIWAQAANGVIGRGGGLPWHLPEDFAHFKACTTGTTVIMGRCTWESLPARSRPLPERRNVVLSRRPGWQAVGAATVPDLGSALALALHDEAWVIGGAGLYAQAMHHADRLEITELSESFDGDTVAPSRGPGWVLAAVDPATGWRTSRTGLQYRFRSYRRP